MAAPVRLGGQQRLQTVQAPSPVGGLNSVSPYGAMDPTEAIVMTNLIPSAYGARTRLGSAQWTQKIGSTQATGVFTPPTSGTANVVIGGLPLAACAFNTNATVTITNFKAVLAARADISAIVSWTGTTNLTFTSLQPGTAGNAVTTTTSGGSGASWGAGTLTGGVNAALEVRSVLGYQGTVSSNDRLFLACIDGIYDASSWNTAATKVVSFSSPTGNAGYCTATSFTALGGNFFLVVDEVNGLFVYDETNAAWHASSNGAGAWQVADAAGSDVTIPGSFTSVMTWQNRVWFTQRASGKVWYLGTGQIPNITTGVTANAYNAGVNMPRGGEIRCMKNWSVDGGAGVENNLAILASSGDISVFTGTDPSTVGKFTLVGTWSFAGIPAGRRVAIDSGGDVLILTSYGLVSLSKLLQGATLADRTIYETRKIDNLISTDVANNATSLAWGVQLSPDESSVLINAPQADGSIAQYAMNYQTKGWGKLTGRSAHAMGIWRTHLYFGDGSGNLWQASGGTDSAPFNAVGTPISFSVFSSFQGLGAPSQRKRIQMVRPVFLTGGSDLNWYAYARFDYDLSQLVTLPSSSASGSSSWDTGNWDSAIWGGDLIPSSTWAGAQGMGKMVALYIVGVCSTTTALNSVDVLYEVGGLW